MHSYNQTLICRGFPELPWDTRRRSITLLSTGLKRIASGLATVDASEMECNIESLKMYSFLTAEVARALSDVVDPIQTRKPKAVDHKDAWDSARASEAWGHLLDAACAVTQVDLKTFYHCDAHIHGIARCLFDVVCFNRDVTPSCLLHSNAGQS
jgi:hypothetical protein